MKTNVATTSIDCFHGRVQFDKHGQHALILSVMELERNYTGQELSHATGLSPNIISARLFELREDEKKIERNGDKRVCPHSHVLVYTHSKLPIQAELLLEDAA